MTPRPTRLLAGLLVTALTAGMAPAADAAEPRLVRAVLLRVADRMSLALEMTGEPERASLRVLSATVIEIEAGPVSGRITDEQLAPSVNAFVRQVSLQKYTAPNRLSFLRARVMLDAPVGGNVRVVGRTIYLDLAPTSPSRPALLAAGPPPVRDTQPQIQRAAPVAAPPVAVPPVAVAPSRRTSYADAVVPHVTRLTEIAPFLLSATATPAPDVLEAVGRTLTAVEVPLRGLDVPAASRPAHNLLMSAVANAQRAVATDFSGDRASQARRAIALLEAAKVEVTSPRTVE
jgi:hypothetical protein